MLRTKNEIWVRIANVFIAYQGTLTTVGINSELGKFLRAVSLEGEEFYSAVYDVYYDTFISTATGQGLDDRASDFGLTRKAATTVTVPGYVFYGEPGKKLTKGFLVQKNGTTLRYSTDADVTINSDGQGIVNLTAIAAGSSYRAEANGIQDFATTPPSGINEGTNPARTVGGSDQEQDEELRARIRTVLDYLAHGTPYAVTAAAQNVSGVRYAAYQEDYPQIGTDTLIVADYAGLLYSALRDQVAEAVKKFRASGRQHSIAAATLANVLIDSTVILQSGYTAANIQPDYETAVKGIFGSQLSFGSKVYPEALKPQAITGMVSTRAITLRIGIDCARLPGVEIYDYSYRSAPVERVVLPVYYNPSAQTITIGNVAIPTSIGQTTISIDNGDIATVKVYIDPTNLPTRDIADQFVFIFTKSAGFQCPDYVLPVCRSVNLTSMSEDLINA